jgi:4-alpha-glucanotransferase
MGLRVYADMQVGMGHRDRKLFGPLLLAGYALGAPPSRTNPEGQPWGYPLFDPTQLAPGGAARALFEQRLDLLLRDHDGLRVDHPHGLVCPWVYRTDLADPLRAVQAGARLHESPDLPDHPALRRYARVRPEQIDASVTRYDDRRVRWLEAPQIDAYATAFDLIVARARAHGVSARDLCAEVLSTCPVPLRAVLTRHGLGRFRVTQKARVDIPEDVYRSDNADAMDWVMVGNHDTDPLTLLTERWHATPEASRRAEYLARRLCPSERERAPMAVAIAQDTQAMAQAMFADLFVGPARQVLVFWADLFGVREVYNRPGVVHPDNWTLRVPRDFEHAYAQATRHGAAPSLPSALATALRARGLDHDDGRALTERLDALAHEP